MDKSLPGFIEEVRDAWHHFCWRFRRIILCSASLGAQQWRRRAIWLAASIFGPASDRQGSGEAGRGYASARTIPAPRCDDDPLEQRSCARYVGIKSFWSAGWRTCGISNGTPSVHPWAAARYVRAQLRLRAQNRYQIAVMKSALAPRIDGRDRREGAELRRPTFREIVDGAHFELIFTHIRGVKVTPGPIDQLY